MTEQLTFDEATHTYRVDSKPIPYVTQIMAEMGIIDTTWFRDGDAARGTAVHGGCSLITTNDLDWGEVDEHIAGYLIGYERFLKTTKLRVISSERRVWSLGHWYAGTLDLLVMLNDELTVIDIKSGSMPEWCALQTAAYSLALPAQERPQRRRGLQLMDDGKFRLTEPYDDQQDERDWIDLVRLFHRRRHLGRLLPTITPKILPVPSGNGTASPSRDVGAGEAQAPAQVIEIASDAGMRQVRLDEIVHAMKKRWPGNSADAKSARAAAIERHFARKGWKEVTDMPLPALEAGLESLRGDLIPE